MSLISGAIFVLPCRLAQFASLGSIDLLLVKYELLVG